MMLESWAVPSYIFSSFSMFVLNHSQVTLLASAFEVEYATMFLTSCFFTWPLNENSSAFATRSGLLKLANPSRYRNRSEERLRYLEGLSSFNKPNLVAKALEFSLSGQVKKQDVRNIVAYSTSKA